VEKLIAHASVEHAAFLFASIRRQLVLERLLLLLLLLVLLLLLLLLLFVAWTSWQRLPELI